MTPGLFPNQFVTRRRFNNAYLFLLKTSKLNKKLKTQNPPTTLSDSVLRGDEGLTSEREGGGGERNGESETKMDFGGGGGATRRRSEARHR